MAVLTIENLKNNMEDTRTKSTVLIDDVRPDLNQPRKTFTEKHISELATSLQTEGFIHPIEVDGEMKIIVGECRWRAAKQAGLTEIPVIINSTAFTPYERLRRQISENMMQSGGDKSEMMNPIDTAKGLARLLILKAYNTSAQGGNVSLADFSNKIKFKDHARLYQAISAYSNKELIEVYNSIPREILYGLVKELCEETGINDDTVSQLLNLLDQPEFVITDIQEGRPRTYYREADKASGEIKEKIKEKIASGDYRSRDEVSQDVKIAKTTPDLAVFELERQKSKESTKTNRILNGIVHLALALEGQPLESVETREQPIVVRQLEYIKKEIETYLSKGSVLVGEETHEQPEIS